MNTISLRTFSLSPVDAWFFRDGRPYNAREASQTDVASLFPPPATTVVGALRAAIARSRSWNGSGNWIHVPGCAEVLGRNFDDLGCLRFQGPWLLQKNKIKTDVLVPMPLHVLGCEEESTDARGRFTWQPKCLLTPETTPTLTDLGPVRLPVPSVPTDGIFGGLGLKHPTEQWITLEGLLEIQNGQIPDAAHIRKSSTLFAEERRVALSRSEISRTTQDGDLYSPVFIRLHPGVSVAMGISGLPSGWQVPSLLPLGGEGRLAGCEEQQLDGIQSELFGLQRLATAAGKTPRKLAITLITPMIPHEGTDEAHSASVDIPRAGCPFFGCHGTTVISACVGKPQYVGGWDSLQRCPLPLRPVIPAGSTWFLEIADPAPLRQLVTAGLGLKTSYGFGHAISGEWPPDQPSTL